MEDKILLKEQIEVPKNPGLKANVISMYSSRFRTEGFFRPRIAQDVIIQGKLKEHTVDIYFEFVQMNNLERTIIKIIENREVTKDDVWEFTNVLRDLHFYAKGIVYYDDRASKEAEQEAELTNIDLKKFVFSEEVIKSVANAVKIMLPDVEVIGDPFWAAMEIEEDSDKNTGNYIRSADKILLFLSKKQAVKYCNNLHKRAKVFGITQNHLKILVDLQEHGIFPDFIIVFPEFEQTEKDSIIGASIPYKEFKKFYLRGDNYE